MPEGTLLKAVIGPHAGFSYSGPTQAWAYKNIDPEKYDRVFLLGPAHHTWTAGCALSHCTKFSTPLGDLKIDREVTEELSEHPDFEFYS